MNMECLPSQLPIELNYDNRSNRTDGASLHPKNARLGKSLIPMMRNTPEDIQTLLELGGVHETLGRIRGAITTHERARQLNPDCLPENARVFLDADPVLQP